MDPGGQVKGKSPLHPGHLLRNFLLRNVVAQIEFLIHLTPVAHWPNPFLTVPDFWTYLQQVGKLELNPCFTASIHPMPNCRLFQSGEAGVKSTFYPLLPPMPNCRLLQGGEANQLWKKNKHRGQATFSFAAQLHSNDFGTLQTIIQK